ncbi:MAG: prenyltransferase/squalene oxidase repeat-containing protein [Candidatus Ranarchaeia archaeon]
MTLKQEVENAIEHVLRYVWETQHSSKGWPAVAGRNPHILDTAELLYGLLAHVRRYDLKLEGVHDFLATNIQKGPEAWNLQESPRVYLWTQLALYNLGDSNDSAIMKFVESKIQEFHVDGKGWRPRSGYPCNTYDTALALIVKSEIGQIDQSVKDGLEYLMVQQNMDGGWGAEPSHRSNPVSTAISMYALSKVGGVSQDILEQGAKWLETHQLKNGGWPLFIESLHIIEDHLFLNFSEPWAIMALLAAGRPADSERITKGVRYVLSLQNEDGGFSFYHGFPWSKGEKSTTWATGFALRMFHEYLKQA